MMCKAVVLVFSRYCYWVFVGCDLCNIACHLHYIQDEKKGKIHSFYIQGDEKGQINSNSVRCSSTCPNLGERSPFSLLCFFAKNCGVQQFVTPNNSALHEGRRYPREAGRMERVTNC